MEFQVPFHPSFHLWCGETQRNIGPLRAALRNSHGFSPESERLGLSSRVRRAAPSLQMQSEEPAMARSSPAKTAILTVLPHRGTSSGAMNDDRRSPPPSMSEIVSDA